jgi:uncharacterized protein (DUF697 family)
MEKTARKISEDAFRSAPASFQEDYSVTTLFARHQHCGRNDLSMKHQNKGQNQPARRSRSRGKDVTVDTSLVNTEAGANEVSLTDPLTPPGESAVSVAPIESIPKVSVAVAEPPSTAAALPSVIAPTANGGTAVRELSAPHSVPVATSLRPRAEQIVKEYVPLAVGAGMIPLPGVDLAAIAGLQLKVLASLAEHYKVSFTKAQAELIVTSLLGSVGTTVLAGAALLSIAKIVPLFGVLVGAASMPVAGGVITRAMGHLAIDHFEAGGTMESFDLDVAQKAFLEKITEARTARA